MKQFLRISAVALCMVLTVHAQRKNKAKLLLDQMVAKTKSYKKCSYRF